MERLNRMATELVDEAVDFAEELGVAVHRLEGDATVLDFGVDAPGGLEAGLLLAEVQTSGLATLATRMDAVAGAPRTHVDVSTDRPALALLCSQTAGWELQVDGFEGLGSGPARALRATEGVFERVGYRDDSDFAVLVVESDELPGESVAAHVAEAAGVTESAVFLPAFRAGSLTGSVLAAARTAEAAVYRLSEVGYDPLDIRAVSGSAPVAPVAGDEETALARTTDAVAYGGRVHLVVDEPSDRFPAVASSAASEYGRPLQDVFDDVDWSFEEIPPEVFGPAQVTVDVVGGQTTVFGETHDTLLAESFGH